MARFVAFVQQQPRGRCLAAVRRGITYHGLALHDLRENQVDIVTLGQYLQPSPRLLRFERYLDPEEFQEFKRSAEKLGFRHVESGPLVRSSYHAWSHVN